jgi:hypothetical protein
VNEPTARISGDGKWALCTDISCGFRFARIVNLKSELADSLRERWPTKTPTVTYEFGGGWVVRRPGWDEDTVWWMPQRSYERTSRGLLPANRRDPLRSKLRPKKRRSRRPNLGVQSGFSVEGVGPEVDPDGLVFEVSDTVECPACRGRPECRDHVRQRLPNLAPSS